MTSAASQRTEQAPVSKDGRTVKLRRCLVRHKAYPANQLIRFVVAPDGAVVPDPGGRLPGRGLWLGASRDIVETARERRLFDRAAKQSVTVAPDIADQIESLLLRRCLDLVGMARRAGDATAGFEKARAVLMRGEVALLLIAADGAEGSIRKLFSGGDGAMTRPPVLDLFDREELGQVFDRDRTVFAAIANIGIAAKLKDEAHRLAGFRGLNLAGISPVQAGTKVVAL